MRMLYIPILLAIAINALAAENTEMWACQTEAASGLHWDDGQWKVYRFLPERLILRVENQSGRLTWRETRYSVFCERREDLAPAVPHAFLECSKSGGMTITINTVEGKGAFATLLGAIMPGNDRDSLMIHAIQCDKF